MESETETKDGVFLGFFLFVLFFLPIPSRFGSSFKAGFPVESVINFGIPFRV